MLLFLSIHFQWASPWRVWAHQCQMINSNFILRSCYFRPILVDWSALKTAERTFISHSLILYKANAWKVSVSSALALQQLSTYMCLHPSISWLYCVEWIQYSICPKRSAICNPSFPGPTWVVDANVGISNCRSLQPFFPGLLYRWLTDQTDHAIRSTVGNNRRSSKWRSQILLFSTATTGIGAVDSTDRINFCNQL